MTAPAASSQLGWLLKHLDAMTDDELLTLHREITRRAARVHAERAADTQMRFMRVLAQTKAEGRGRSVS